MEEMGEKKCIGEDVFVDYLETIQDGDCIGIKCRNKNVDAGPRRSTRDPQFAQLQTPQVQSLLHKIKSNHEDTVVLKIKDHLVADINSVVMDAILEALWKNKVCQVRISNEHIQRYQTNTGIRLSMFRTTPRHCDMCN